MPRRNMWVICLAFAVSLVCYQRADRNRYLGTIAEAMNLIDALYVKDVEPRELYENAMRGMAEGLDPYSTYIKPTEYKELQDGLEQKFGGIGVAIEVDVETKRLTVMSPLVNTPAYRAGIKSGDVILAIEGHDTVGMTTRDAADLIQGDPGTTVRLTIQHLGEEKPVELTITRAIIPIDSVLGDVRRPDGTWDFTLTDHPQITYLRVLQFGSRTVEELTKSLKGRPAQAVILDLRDNSGGLLDAAVETCSLFIPKGQEIVSTRSRGNRVHRIFKADGSVLLKPDVPMVVLTNHYSASASEIVAACLQDYGRAKIVGQRSWGKGTVQNVFRLEGGQAALKFTTATYWRPSGKNIHRHKGDKDDADWGVTPDPDFAVVLPDEQADQIRKQRRHKDTSNGPDKPAGAPEKKTVNGNAEAQPQSRVVDPQLAKAVEYLEAQLAASKQK